MPQTDNVSQTAHASTGSPAPRTINANRDGAFAEEASAEDGPSMVFGDGPSSCERDPSGVDYRT